MAKTQAREVLLNVLLLLLTLTLMEAILRISGYSPIPAPRPSTDRTLTIQKDEVLGWSMRPGSYQMVPAELPGSNPITFTVYQDGSRATRLEPAHSGPVVALLGGSFVQGHGLSNEQTLGWKLQQALPQLNVKNFAVAAFGSVQALRMLERLGNSSSARPSHFIYAFCDFHEARNVLDPGNLRAISRYSSSGKVLMPYADLDKDGTLLHFEPQSYIELPLRHTLSLAKLVEDALIYPATWMRRLRAREVTQAVIVQMKTKATEYGAGFSVLLLDVDSSIRGEYMEFLNQNGIDAINCVDARYDNPSFQLPNDPHPNEAMIDIWAACAAHKIRELLKTD
jgi:hypothetical protein